MTYPLDVISSRQLSARWCALAEKRLDHLTELFETGRWRRYYSERIFLDNIREAKRAVKNWRALSRGEQIEKPLEISFVVEDDDEGFSLTRPLQKQADQSVRAEPPIKFEPIPSLEPPSLEPPSLAPSIETMIAGPDIVLPEQAQAQDEAVGEYHAVNEYDAAGPYEAFESYDATESDDIYSDDRQLPADIILPDFVAAMPRIDMDALEDALNVEAAEQGRVEQNFHQQNFQEQDLYEQDELEDHTVEDYRAVEPPVLDLDAIARKYPALRATF